MAEAMPDWYVVLVCGGLAVLLGVSVLLCAMILDDRRDAAARVLALRGWRRSCGLGAASGLTAVGVLGQLALE